MKKTNRKTNRLTGGPRKWVCRSHAAIDSMLERAELWHYFYMLAKVTGAESPMEVMPPDVLRYLVESDQASLSLLEKFLKTQEPLTAAEKRYCEAEAIPLEDFIRRMPRR